VIPLLTAEEMQSLDAHAIKDIGIPGPVLMETAGRGVFNRMMFHFSEKIEEGTAAIVCGKGNNGGDGFVIARCLLNKGFRPTVLLLGAKNDVKGDAAVHLNAYVNSGGKIVEVSAGATEEAKSEIKRACVIVDAILGTGLKDDARGLAAEAIGWINSSRKPGARVVSVDIPSGASSDTGRICGAAVRADLTVTFAYKKRGHRLHPAAELAGRIDVTDIGIPPSALELINPGLLELEEADFKDLPSRPSDSHKKTFGHVYVLGGSQGMAGAPGLAALAALRSGAGLATVAWPLGPAAEARLPLEIMTARLGASGSTKCEGVWDENLLETASSAVEKADAIAIGPGMGVSQGAAAFLKGFLEMEGAPVVIDADALNLIAKHEDVWTGNKRTAIMTPHPGEAARLLKTTTAEIQKDRVYAAESLARRFGCSIILKGAGTLIASPGEATALVPLGNPGMATAGTGDVLTGVLAAFMARGMSVLAASRLAAYTHAMAGDFAADDKGMDGLTASDVIDALPEAVDRIKSISHRKAVH